MTTSTATATTTTTTIIMAAGSSSERWAAAVRWSRLPRMRWAVVSATAKCLIKRGSISTLKEDKTRLRPRPTFKPTSTDTQCQQVKQNNVYSTSKQAIRPTIFFCHFLPRRPTSPKTKKTHRANQQQRPAASSKPAIRARSKKQESWGLVGPDTRHNIRVRDLKKCSTQEKSPPPASRHASREETGSLLGALRVNFSKAVECD